MLPQEPDEFVEAAAFGETCRALVADRTAGLEQFGRRFALVQIDRLRLMAARLRFRRGAPGRCVAAALRKDCGGCQPRPPAGPKPESERFDLAAKEVSCPRMSRTRANATKRELCENGL